MVIGETVSRIRKDKGMSRSQLAASVAVSTQYIQQLEVGKKSASLETAAKLAIVLGCTIDELMSGGIHNSSVPQERT